MPDRILRNFSSRRLPDPPGPYTRLYVSHAPVCAGPSCPRCAGAASATAPTPSGAMVASPASTPRSLDAAAAHHAASAPSLQAQHEWPGSCEASTHASARFHKLTSRRHGPPWTARRDLSLPRLRRPGPRPRRDAPSVRPPPCIPPYPSANREYPGAACRGPKNRGRGAALRLVRLLLVREVTGTPRRTS
jgi:hypothetical protein